MACAPLPALPGPRPVPLAPAKTTTKAASTPLPALAAAPPPSPGSLPPAGAPAAGPISLELAAPDARWLVACQARVDSDGDGRLAVTSNDKGELGGDRMQRYLEFASGEEREIDDLLASSADGRWLVLRLEDHTELYDTVSGARRDSSALGADTRSEPLEPGRHRAFAFSENSLFYLRARDNGEELVQQELSLGGERLLYTSKEPIARLRVDVGGKLVVLSVARPENAKQRRFTWPYRLDSAPRPCRGPGARFPAPNPNADPFSTLVVDIEQGSVEPVDALAGLFGQSLVRREADGSLWLTRGKQRQQLTDKACAGRILFSDVESNSFLIGCAIDKKPGRFNVELVGRDARKSLDVDVASLGYDEPNRAPKRLFALYPGANCALYDTEKRTLHMLSPGDAVLSTQGAHALVRRGKSLFLFDADSRRETDLKAPLDPFGDVLVTGSLVFASPWLVDLESGRVRGPVAGKGLALASSGAVLVPAQPPSERALAEGPLTWRRPE
ncbi:MAG: hypothetical protein QM756_41085 [Polyangiaceae bacterium]